MKRKEAVHILQKYAKIGEYGIFMYRIKQNRNLGMDMPQAMDQAASDCAASGILKELLMKGRKEVRDMALLTLNKEAEIYERHLREEGRIEGVKELNVLYGKLLDGGRQHDVARAIRDREYLEKLYQEYPHCLETQNKVY